MLNYLNLSSTYLFDAEKKLIYILTNSTDKYEINKTKVELSKIKFSNKIMELNENMPFYNPEYVNSVKDVLYNINHLKNIALEINNDFKIFNEYLINNNYKKEIIYNYQLEFYEFVMEVSKNINKIITNNSHLYNLDMNKNYFNMFIQENENNITDNNNKKNELVKTIKEENKIDMGMIKNLPYLNNLFKINISNNYISDDACNYYSCNSGSYNITISPCCDGDF